MPRVVQEKFEVRYPDVNSSNEEDVQGWVTDMESRTKKGQHGWEGIPGGDYDSRYANNALFLQSLPPGMDIEDQEISDIRKMGINISGNFPDKYAEGDVTNREVHAVSLRKGFDKKALLQTDDAYTREHNDSFYDDVGGFCERNNYLDRS
jgi:hypothetical protein